MSFYYTYVLFSEQDHKLYIGFTSDVFKRVAEHNAGLNTSTAPRRPLTLIYFEGHLVKEDALRRESYFKTSSGKRTLQIILKQTLLDLRYQQ
ncbi:MAG: GIY-YIG nuclease family protein [Saprospiraceae bacterium]|nr:GIY-YIG nuclease family protein [Candidatus Opimibacter iunctus]